MDASVHVSSHSNNNYILNTEHGPYSARSEPKSTSQLPPLLRLVPSFLYTPSSSSTPSPSSSHSDPPSRRILIVTYGSSTDDLRPPPL